MRSLHYARFGSSSSAEAAQGVARFESAGTLPLRPTDRLDFVGLPATTRPIRRTKPDCC